MGEITIALDAMGGDFGPRVVVRAALRMLRLHPDLSIILVGNEKRLAKRLRIYNARKNGRLTIQHASQTVAMDELPSHALRTKKDSSMRVAINMVKEGRAQACVSAGNTGALMATARFVLKTLPGIHRPAIITEMPAIAGHVRMLDLGANVECTAENLYQFAVMGSVLTSVVENSSTPTVALLNIGEEEIKGNETIKGAAQLLIKSKYINYIGYVEGNDIFNGACEVVVCDGFVGNVALKSSEGAAKLFGRFLKDSFTKNLWTKMVGFIAKPILKRFAQRIDPARYNGASLVGLNGIVIKSHGSANILAFSNAIEEAIKEVKHDVPHLIGQKVGELLE